MAGGGIALVLLAAGRASRFGGGKLAASLCGMTVAARAALAYADVAFASRIVVCAPDTPFLPGYRRVPLDPPGAPLSRSIATGVVAARAEGVEAVMIALADMPLVPRDHVAALIAAFDGDRICTHGPDPMPPALFGARHFAALEALEGDRGAGRLLRGAPGVSLDAELAIDIDSAEDLARAKNLLGTMG